MCMKPFIAIAVLMVAVFVAYAYFHSRSIDRAHFVSSANDLLVAHRQLRDIGSLPNQLRISVWTNRITVGTAMFQGELVADAPALANRGLLVVAIDETLIWIDKTDGPSVVRGADGWLVLPKSLND